MRPQVILMDLVLPGMDGTEGVRRIQEIDPNIHVIVLTVYGDDDRIFDALCAGACGYLLKPGTEGRIVAAIETALEGGAPITPFIARRVLTIFTRYITKRGDYQLTQREREVLQLLVEGSSQREIAARLSVSPHTIDTHIRHIYSRLKVRSQGAAVAKAIRERLL
jgi:DNA-binding NarL/FixJ family response regulator